jgi:predicted AAA+ superfamily ATPase
MSDVLHPVLHEALNAAVVRTPQPATRRDAHLPNVPGKVHAIIGMRRSGKTTYLLQLHGERLAGGQAAERTLYLNFDDERLAELPLAQFNSLVEEYYRRFPQFRGREKVTWLLDEIQWVAGWERFVRRMLDTEKVELMVSGASARMLSREVHTSLRGRGMETIIRPFSFREYLRHRGAEPARVDWLTSPERSQLENHFLAYLAEGGFPEAQGLGPQTRVNLLQGYVDTVLFRDVVERYQVSQVAALRWLTRQFLKNAASLFSVHKFAQDLKSQGKGVGKDTLHAMVAQLEDAFLIRSVALATESERRRNSNPRKVYPADTGLIGAFDRSGRANLGHALETVVIHELDRRGAEVGYVRTEEGYEVDFLARYFDHREELIQVCASPTLPEIQAREFRALEGAAREYPNATKRLLILTHDAMPVQAPPGVIVQPAYEWLLMPA